MSFSASIGSTALNDFAAVVASCPVSPPEDQLTEESQALLAEARDTLVALSKLPAFGGTDVYLAGSLSGHAPDTAAGLASISLSLYQTAHIGTA